MEIEELGSTNKYFSELNVSSFCKIKGLEGIFNRKITKKLTALKELRSLQAGDQYTEEAAGSCHLEAKALP